MKFDTIIMCIVDMIYRYIESSLKESEKNIKNNNLDTGFLNKKEKRKTNGNG